MSIGERSRCHPERSEGPAVRTPWRALGLLLVASTAVAQSVPFVRVRAENTLSVLRTDETIALKWSDVMSRLPQASPTKVRVVDPGTGTEVVSQVVDNDGDGTMDELIFQATFAPGEAKSFTVEATAATAKPAKQRVYAAHMMPRDDVAWESDRIAYRIYGQGLWKVDSLLSSGVDVWVKRVRDPIVEKWYAKGHDEYHHDNGEGADFFDVGQSLGAGGTAIWKNDTLYRAWNFKSQRVIANGPVRAIFELQYQPWDAPGMRVTETKRIALDAGHNLNHVTSIFRAESGGPDIPWATGLVKRKNVIGLESKAQPWAWLTEWGPVLPKDGGHGDLGLAVLLPRTAVLDWKETNDHYLAISRARSGQPVDYYIGAGWTDSGDYRDVKDWYTYLDLAAQRLSTPIVVTFSNRSNASER
jgi:pectinesterase